MNARWLADGVEIAVDTAVGVKIRGSFRRVAGSYEVGADGTKIELAVDATSFEARNGLWDTLLRPADKGRLADHPELRFRSTEVRDPGNGTLRIEGYLEAAGKVETVAFDAKAKLLDGGLRLDAVALIDRDRLGNGGERFAAFLPATLHVTTHFRA